MHNKQIMESKNAKWLTLIIKKKAIKDKEYKKLRESFVSSNIGVKFKLTKGQRGQMRNSNPIILNPSSDLLRTYSTSRPQISNYNIMKSPKKITTDGVQPIEPPSTNSASLIDFQRNSSQVRPLFSKRLFKPEIIQKSVKEKDETSKSQTVHHLRNATTVTTSEIISKNQKWYSKRRIVKLVLVQLWKLVAGLLNSKAKWTSIHYALENLGSNISNKLTDFMFPRELKLYYYELPDSYAKTLIESNDLSLALEYFKNFLASNESLFLQVKLCESLCYFNVGKYTEAIELLNELLRKYPNNSYILYNLAVFYLKIREWMTCSLTCAKCIGTVNDKAFSCEISEFTITSYRMKCICNFQMGYTLQASEDYMNAARLIRTKNVQQALQISGKKQKHMKILIAKINFDTQIVLESARSGLVNEIDKNDPFLIYPEHETLITVRGSKAIRKNTIIIPLISSSRKNTLSIDNLMPPMLSKRGNGSDQFTNSVVTIGLRTPRSAKQQSTFGVMGKQNSQRKTSFAPSAKPEHEKEELKEEQSILPLSIVNRRKNMDKKRLEDYQHTRSRIERLKEKLDSSDLLKDNPKSMIQGSINLEKISNLRSIIGTVIFQ